jgi:hypothetical protein
MCFYFFRQRILSARSEKMQASVRIAFLSVCFILSASIPSLSQDQTVPGAGNQNAINLSSKSPLVQSAQRFLISQAERINDSNLGNYILDSHR